MINLFVFILGYWVIREKKEYWLVPILFLFTWNRETVVLLIMVYFFYRYDELPLKKLLTRTLLFILVFGVSYLLIKKFYGYHELYGNIDWAKTNLTDYKTYIYAFLLFGVFGWWGMKDLKSKPKFLVRALLMFPYFFVTHWFVGYLSETRYYYPLLPIIIPLGLHTLFGIKEGYPDSETKKVDNYLTKQFKLFYFIFFAIFLISFKIYFQKTYHPYIEKTRITTSYDKAIENGFFYAEKGDYEKAISDFTKAIELSPENSETYNNRGFAYMNKGYYDEALADFNKAIEINPKYSKAYNNRGLSYYNKKLYDEAISDFNKAIELDPKYSKAYNNRGLTYKEKGIYDKALADYNIALKLAPDNPRISWNIAIIYCEYKQWDKAIQYINRVIELNPTYPEARKYLDIAKTQMENAGNKTEKQ